MQINDDFCVSFVYLLDSHYYMDDTVLWLQTLRLSRPLYY